MADIYDSFGVADIYDSFGAIKPGRRTTALDEKQSIGVSHGKRHFAAKSLVRDPVQGYISDDVAEERAYLISRGLAKSGSSDPYTETRDDSTNGDRH